MSRLDWVSPSLACGITLTHLAYTEPLEQNPTYFSPPDPAIADMLKLSEKRIQELEQTRATLEARILDQENETMLLREQLSKRDREITRIGTQLEVSKHHQFGSTASAIFVPSSSDQKEDLNAATFSDLATARERLEQLEIQIEFLQDHNDALEKVCFSLMLRVNLAVFSLTTIGRNSQPSSLIKRVKSTRTKSIETKWLKTFDLSEKGAMDYCKI